MNAYVSGVLLFLRERQGERENFQNPLHEYTKQTNKNKPSSFKRTNSKASSSRQFPIRTAELEYVLLLNVVVSVVVVVIFVWCVCSAIAPSDDVQVFAGGGLTFRFEAKLRKI